MSRSASLSGSASPSAVAKRLPHLDALRGIAAFVVVLHHAFLSLPAPAAPRPFVPGAGPLVLGRPAVILFFVLSGFVLTLCLGSERINLASFAARRLVRLLPPYWFAIIISFAAFALVPRHQATAMSGWFNDYWSGAIMPADVLRHLLMVAGPRQYPLDHVAWSLVHELRLSLVLPLLILLATRCGVIACVLATAAVALAADVYIAGNAGAFPLGIHGFLFDAPGLGDSLVLSARFGVDFAIGIALAMRAAEIATIYARLVWLRPVAIFAALTCLSLKNETAMAAGAALLVSALASSAMLARALDIAPLAWLGRVSYSLYLIHLPIMLTCGLLLDRIVPAPASLAVGIVLALAAAQVMWRVVEMPSIRWSRAAAKMLKRRPSQLPQPPEACRPTAPAVSAYPANAGPSELRPISF